MTYAIISNGAITAHGTARELWPGAAFSKAGPNVEFLAENNAVAISRELPYNPETHYLRSVEPYLLDGTVYNVEAVERPPVPPTPRWQDFQVALLTDPQVHGMMMAAKDVFPGLISAWSTGLGQAAVGQGTETFMTAWGLARALTMPAGHPQEGDPLIPDSLAAHIAGLATAADLPAEFVAGLNPEPVAP